MEDKKIKENDVIEESILEEIENNKSKLPPGNQSLLVLQERLKQHHKTKKVIFNELDYAVAYGMNHSVTEEEINHVKKLLTVFLQREPAKREAKESLPHPQKFILDACCGGRMFWNNKHHPNTLYIDNRIAEKGHRKHRVNHEVKPDMVMDFRKMDLPDSWFKLVVWDPPQMLTLTETSDMRKTFGVLNAETWQDDLRRGFNECWRVLEDYGVLIFKWNEAEIKVKDVEKLFHTKALFGHPSGTKSKTHWLCFMKIPGGNYGR